MYAQNFTCMQCFREEGFPPEEYSVFPINDDLAFSRVCSRGHKEYVVFQVQKYELLFEIAINALMDGYVDAAVSRFAASLERFFEYYTYVALLKTVKSTTELDVMWKSMAKQSERQYGAFLVAWEMGRIERLKCNLSIKLPESAKIGGRDFTNFRNLVVHSGYIPLIEDAKSYAFVIYEFINAAHKFLVKYHPENMLRVTCNNMDKKVANKPVDHYLSTSSPPMAISAISINGKCQNIDDVINLVKSYKVGFKKANN